MLWSLQDNHPKHWVSWSGWMKRLLRTNKPEPGLARHLQTKRLFFTVLGFLLQKLRLYRHLKVFVGEMFRRSAGEITDVSFFLQYFSVLLETTELLLDSHFNSKKKLCINRTSPQLDRHPSPNGQWFWCCPPICEQQMGGTSCFYRSEVSSTSAGWTGGQVELHL